MTFKYILVVILISSLYYVLLLPKQTVLRKIVMLCFLLVMLLFSMKPDWSTTVAHIFGVGRGADFLFYISHLVVFYMLFAYYLKIKDMEARFTKLVRKLAMLEADNELNDLQTR